MRCFLFTIFLLVLSATGAEAKYSFCNKSSYVLSSAIGYVDGDRLATRGWWRLRPGECKFVLTEQAIPGRYFVFAEAISGHKGPLRTWSGDTSLCVKESGFFNILNQDICRDAPERQRHFFDVEVTEKAGGNWQTDFTEARSYTVYSAEVAGVQRLLRDAGFKLSRIDGAMGRSTQRALANYRKEKGLTANTGIDNELIDALIDDVNAEEAKLGLFYCNKTNETIWSAIAEPSAREIYNSRGWWKINPGACAKIIKGELEKNHYYVYAATEDGATETPITNGDKDFCVNAIKFSITDEKSCEEQELEKASFRRIDIGGADSATFDFLPEMFVPQPTDVDEE